MWLHYLISIIGKPILVRRQLYIELTPMSSNTVVTFHDCRLSFVMMTSVFTYFAEDWWVPTHIQSIQRVCISMFKGLNSATVLQINWYYSLYNWKQVSVAAITANAIVVIIDVTDYRILYIHISIMQFNQLIKNLNSNISTTGTTVTVVDCHVLIQDKILRKYRWVFCDKKNKILASENFLNT